MLHIKHIKLLQKTHIIAFSQDMQKIFSIKQN